MRGRRLVYSYGVYALAGLSALLLVIFGGVTDRLIPLFAVGAFLSFTLSQAGMVAHWRKQRGHGAKRRMLMNATGAIATGITVLIVTVAKFIEGAWVIILLMPGIIAVMIAIRHHYRRVHREIAETGPLSLEQLQEPLVVVPVDEWNKVAQKALRFALTLSRDIQVIHVDSGEKSDDLKKKWDEWVAEPVRRNRTHAPELVVIRSPYRYVVTPILNYVLDLERRHKDRQIAVVVSELVERRWYHYFLHNQRAEVLTALLTLGGDRRIAVVNVPWYLNA
jgi:hypothetical protein